MTRGPAIAIALCLTAGPLAACGGNAAPAQPPAVARVTPEPSAPAEQPPLLVEYVVIHRPWVEKLVPMQPAELEAWSRAPENADAVTGALRRILFAVPAGEKDPGLAAKKKAQAAITRIEKGEDFGKVAKQLSEDARTKDSGGELAPDMVNELPPALASAFAALAPGQTSKEPVRSPGGWEVLQKARASDDQIERAYRRAKAPEVTKKLADELLLRLKGNADARPAIAEAVLAVLGDRGANDANRPKASLVDRERLKQVRMSPAAKAALETFAQSAHPGDVFPSPAVDGDTIVVARARAAAGE